MVDMKNVLLKETLREIKWSFSRFISIFLIVALGVAFFAGIKATCPDMKATADKYFDDYNLMDIRLISTIGFNDDDVKAVKKVSGVNGIMPTYSMDTIAKVQNKELVLKVLALPMDKIYNPDESYINRVKLISGRMPERTDECVTEKGKILNSGLTIGSKIKLSSGTDTDISKSLKVSEFTIVGIVETPFYISFDRGTSSIGNGKVNNFIMIPDKDFRLPYYTDIFLTVKNAKNALCYDTNYDDIIKPVKDALENVGKERSNTRYNEIIDFQTKELNIQKYKLWETERNKTNGISYADLLQQNYNIQLAEDKINKFEKPEWYILDRKANLGYTDYKNAADTIDAISLVFPAFFFLIAALVSLTTMTRMVDEQRTSIGTHKALGYNKTSAALKYLLYAALASISGSIFGLLVGFKVFPTVIFNAYGIMYTLPPVITSFNFSYAAISTASAILATTLSAWLACYNELMLKPALLMRPKTPKAGKRIFLEKIRFIWSRFNFIQKITARNIFRYKKRFLMTVIGISGCTALLVSGFGLRDSIMSIFSKQFDELYKYDMLIDMKQSIASGESNDLLDQISKDERILKYMLINQKNVDAGIGNYEKSAILFIPQNTEKIEDYIILKDPSTGKKVMLNDKGVILTQKLALMLHAKIGDKIYIKDNDDKKVEVKVANIIENYVLHYIYMSPSLYESVYGEKIKYKQFLGKIANNSDDFENKLSSDLLESKDASSINFITSTSKNFKDILGRLNYVVLVLIISAGALAFIVLYNLTNINITERIREIASIKVLGFYDNEVSAYVYRENFILTLIGMFLGLGLGILLHKFIIDTVEVDYVMFSQKINPLSFVYSAILTIVFSGLVNLAMYFRLKNISMVESLKSID